MCSLKHYNILVLVTFVTVLVSCKAQYPDLKDGLYAEFITNSGTMVAELNYKKAPVTVANFVSLAEGKNLLVNDKFKKKPFYNGTIFHRVINNFMIQGGDPTGTGSGSPGYKFMDEFHEELRHDKPGILSMANSGPRTNGSQFFITEKPTPFLDDKHAVFGELVLGLDVQDSISNVKTGENDRPINDVVIESLNIIRKGKDAKAFNAPKIFSDHFAIEARKVKEKEARKAAILKQTKDKFRAQKARATTLASGLQFVITEEGTGKKLPEIATVITHYAVYFEDGKLLETSNLKTAEALGVVNQSKKNADKYQPLTANIGPDAQMIAGFKEGLQQLRVGDKATLFIPYHLAYGESGTRGIPKKSNLIFEVEVLELIK